MAMKVHGLVPPLAAGLAVSIAVLLAGWNQYAEFHGIPFPGTIGDLGTQFADFLGSGRPFRNSAIIGLLAGGLTAGLWRMGRLLTGRKVEPVAIRPAMVLRWLAVITVAALVSSAVLYFHLFPHH